MTSLLELVRRHRVFSRDSYRCFYCRYQRTAETLEIDHLIPPRKGGDLYSMANMRTACRGCNAQKCM